VTLQYVAPTFRQTIRTGLDPGEVAGSFITLQDGATDDFLARDALRLCKERGGSFQRWVSAYDGQGHCLMGITLIPEGRHSPPISSPGILAVSS
jgi:hypothetical protein